MCQSLVAMFWWLRRKPIARAEPEMSMKDDEIVCLLHTIIKVFNCPDEKDHSRKQPLILLYACIYIYIYIYIYAS